MKLNPFGFNLNFDEFFDGLRGWMFSNLIGQGWRSNKLARTLPACLDRAGTPRTP
jgi:hypothetical protein